MSDPRVHPLELDLERSVRLRIRWADGAESRIPLERLRASCPCATCRALREERARNPLLVLPKATSAAALSTVEKAELAGAYALRVTWRDGHDTGIYDFRLLRELGDLGLAEAAS